MTERRLAIELIFEDDDALARFNHEEHADPGFLQRSARDAVRELGIEGVIVGQLFMLHPHGFSPSINRPTAQPFRIHYGLRPSEIAMAAATVARKTGLEPSLIGRLGGVAVQLGWQVHRTSCQCGGDWAWMKPRPSGAWEMVGCVCHTDLTEHLGAYVA